jgi:uncharacterized membrane protein YedE/YeeE
MLPMRPDSISFSGPLARAARFLATGSMSGGAFGIALLGGTLVGAFATALVRGRLRFTRPAPGQARQALAGGVLMGIGGALAGGCNIGQGLTGLATLSVKSLIVVAAILAGMRIALAWLERRPARRPTAGGKAAAQA